MSDFDREAEREKLREQFERDKQKREASERMSELLLQGATMTNRHCSECHSPVFRYDGREFCPTCQREVAVEGDAEAEAEMDADADADAGAEANANADGEPPTPNEEATPPSDGADTQSDVPPRTDGEPLEGPSTEPSEAESRVEPDTDTSASDSVPAPAQDRRPTTPGLPTTRDDDSLAEAEETLRRELVELTRGAEETRDLSRKRTFLAAAREAAETLEAVRRL